jgi:uncharacterized protein involved in exopolysaccharide biosynthesis
MADVNQSPGLPLWSDHVRFLRRHRTGIAVLMGLGLLAGLVWSLQQPATYSATASVALARVPVYVTASTTELVPPEVSIDTDAQLMHSPVVLGAVGDVLGTDTEAAAKHLLVTATPNSSVLHVTVRAPTAELAARAAGAAVTAFVEVRRDSLGALEHSQLRQLRRLVTTQEQLLAQEQARRLVIPEHDELFARIVQLHDGLDELERAHEAPAERIRPASPPRGADHPNTEVPVVSGAMVGLLCGCLLGLARDRARRPGRVLEHHPSPPDPSGRRPDPVPRHEVTHHAF